MHHFRHGEAILTPSRWIGTQAIFCSGNNEKFCWKLYLSKLNLFITFWEREKQICKIRKKSLHCEVTFLKSSAFYHFSWEGWNCVFHTAELELPHPWIPSLELESLRRKAIVGPSTDFHKTFLRDFFQYEKSNLLAIHQKISLLLWKVERFCQNWKVFVVYQPVNDFSMK